jgi:hypothetical protein
MKIEKQEVALINRLVENINRNHNEDVVSFSEGKIRGNQRYVRYILDHLKHSVKESISKPYNPTEVVDPTDGTKYLLEKSSDGIFFLTRTVTIRENESVSKTLILKHSDVREMKDLDHITLGDISKVLGNMKTFDRGFGL